MPAAIVDKLHGAIEEVPRWSDTKKNLDEQGAKPLHLRTGTFAAYIKDEISKWGPK